MSRTVVVTGAPGSGKSTVAQELRSLGGDLVVFDMDSLLPAASDLAGVDLIHAKDAWLAYRRLWLDVAAEVARGGRTPVLFGNHTPAEVEAAQRPGEDPVVLIHLDCHDDARRARLRAQGRDDLLEEALTDAAELRAVVGDKLDSTSQSPPFARASNPGPCEGRSAT